MPVHETRRPAYDSPNTLALYEGRLGSLTAEEFQTSVIPTEASADAAQDPSFWTGVSTFFKSPAMSNLINSGLTTYQAREAAKLAEATAGAAKAEADARRRVAEEQMATAQMQQRLTAERAALPPLPPAASGPGGLPGWVIPVAVAGASAVLLFTVIGRRKSA